MTHGEFDAFEEDLSEFEEEAERRARSSSMPKRRKPRFEETLADATDQDPGFQTSYKPARFEAGWLLSSLHSFYQQHLIQDVLSHVKGGKEASVYCCAAHTRTGEALYAAKVYRPRQFRNLRNDQMYREGRPVLTAEGRAAKRTDHRLMRALGKKTEFGVQAQHTSWLMYEYTTLERLYQAGAAVPRPIAASENAILMAYQGDQYRAAPTLSEVTLELAEAQSLFEETLRNIELMLQQGIIHGDLSAYNLLYWAGKITLIDFPQVTDCQSNSNARSIFERDVTRICEYFARHGVVCDPAAIAGGLWAQYGQEPIIPQE